MNPYYMLVENLRKADCPVYVDMTSTGSRNGSRCCAWCNENLEHGNGELQHDLHQKMCPWREIERLYDEQQKLPPVTSDYFPNGHHQFVNTYHSASAHPSFVQQPTVGGGATYVDEEDKEIDGDSEIRKFFKGVLGKDDDETPVKEEPESTPVEVSKNVAKGFLSKFFSTEDKHDSPVATDRYAGIKLIDNGDDKVL